MDPMQRHEPATTDDAPLAWVIDQVRDNLLGAINAVRKHVQLRALDDDTGTSLLLQARGQIHQAAGAIGLLGHDAAARVVRAAEQALAHCIEEPRRLDDHALQLLASGLHAELDFLDARLSGRHDAALKLFKPYRALAEFAGATAHPADLWEFDWNWPAQDGEPAAVALRAVDRSDYERALLELLRGRDTAAAAASMQRVAATAAAAAHDRERTVWRAAEGFFEALGQGLVPSDLYVKRICNRLNLQLKNLLGGQPQPAQRLTHELLFYCDQALARAADHELPALRAVARALQLAPGEAVDYETDYFGRIDPALVQQVRRRLAQVKDGWSMLGNEDFSRVDRLLDALGQLASALRDVQPGAEVLAAAIERMVRAVHAKRALLTPERVLETATALLFLEAAFAHFRADDAEFLEHARELAQRLLRSADGVDAGTFAPWMEALYRRTSETQTLGSVVEELHHDMAEVERLLDGYFRDPAVRPDLESVPRLLAQMRGVLSVLGVEVGAQALGRIRQQVDALIDGAHDEAQARAEGGPFDQLAANIGALGFLIDMLGYQPDLARTLFTFDAERGTLRPRVASTPRRAPSAAQQAAATGGVTDVADAVGSATAAPGDTATAAHVAEPAAAGDASKAPEAAADATTPDAAVSDAEVDPELLGIFLDEAADVIAAGNAVLVHLRADPDADDESSLASVRRAFHTLKGSSRMVGLRDFGEAAWEMEQLFNQVLAKQRAATLPLLDLAKRAFAELDSWAGALRAGDARAHANTGIVAAARALRVGGTQPDIASHGPAPAPEPVAQAHALPQVDTTASPVAELELSDALLLGSLDPTAPTPGSAPAHEPVWESLQEPVQEPAQEPAREPAQEPAQEPVHEPVQEPVWESLQEPLHEPAQEPAQEPVQEPAQEAAQEPSTEAVKQIGDLRIALPLYNIYLSEADELIRRLHADIGAWAAQPEQALSADTAALAHQLRGSSRTVGLHTVGRLAELLEDIIGLQRDAPQALSPADAALLPHAVDDLRRLLHHFAAGFVRQPPPELERALETLILRLRHGAPARAREAFAHGAPPAPPSAAPAPQAPLGLLDHVDAELFAVFEFEATELLPQLASALRQWEARPHDAASPKQAMRLLHTFKGSARMAGAMALGEAAHRLEADIEALLGAASAPEPGALVDAIARCDALTMRFDRLREAQALPDHHAAAPVQAVDADEFEVVEHDGDDETSAPRAPAPARAAVTRQAAQPVRVRAALLDRLVNQVGEVSIARGRLDVEFGQIRSSTRDLGDNLERLRTQVRDIELQADAQMAARAQAARDDGRDFDPLEFDRFTRFQELTRMMAESVNDLALVQTTLTRALQATEDNLSRQARLTRDLQRDLLRTRMVEFDSISERLYRTVRQAGKDSGKAVKLDIVGGTIEVDRGVLDRMAGTFDHLLRNAVAHGLESADARVAAGKDPMGTITLSVRHEGSEVVIAVSDDGAGLDDAAIAQRARALGLIAADTRPDRDQLHELIFRAGFSSMRQATAMAGRGVGLDVVRNDTRALGGRVEVSSVPGRGSTFTLVLPLTTAVTQVVLLRVGTRVYAVPSSLVDLVVRLKPQDAVATAQRRSYADDDAEMPCYWFGALTADSGASTDPVGRSVPLVLVRSAAQRLALLVDEVLGNQEVVVKNLGPQLSRVPGLAGISLLPDGALVLIYNPVGLAAVHGAQAALLMDEARGVDARRAATAEPELPDDLIAVPANTVLVVDDSITVRRVTQRFLSRNGYNVMLAKDGLDALEQLQSSLPDVVLTDIEMPRMDGFDLARNIRADERTRHLPVIMITSRIADKHRNYAEELGVDHYLGKPYSEDELLGLINRYMREGARH